MNPAPPLRLFSALWPGPVTRRALQAWADGLPWPAGARRVRATELHITLHFLGAVPAGQLPAVQQALARPLGRIDLRLQAATLWRGGTVVLEPARLPPALREHQTQLAERLQAAGLVLEARPWRPHVTLARHADGLALPALPAAGLPWHSQGHVLVQSVPGSGYQLLQRFGQ